IRPHFRFSLEQRASHTMPTYVFRSSSTLTFKTIIKMIHMKRALLRAFLPWCDEPLPGTSHQTYLIYDYRTIYHSTVIVDVQGDALLYQEACGLVVAVLHVLSPLPVQKRREEFVILHEARAYGRCAWSTRCGLGSSLPPP